MVARPSSDAIMTSARKRRSSSSGDSWRRESGGLASVRSTREGTSSAITPSPAIATQNETRNTDVNASGASARIPNAISGPIMAPVVSIARCTPNAVPSVLGEAESEISASRGAVRMPLPMRSSITKTAMGATAPTRGDEPQL
jgi:hypothetical protein